MQISEMLSQLGGLQSIARELGVSEAQAASGADALTPALVNGFEQHAQTAAADGGIGAMLSRLGGGGLLENVLSPQPTDVSQGNNILGHIFGSKEVSRDVAQKAAHQSGLDPAVLKKMLPMLAMVVAGYMAKQQHGGAASAQNGPLGGGGLGGLLGGLLGGHRG